MENSTQLLQTFAHVAEHPEQCHDFDIQGNLDKFMQCGQDRCNFSEAGFIIFDAARIYGRKVDFVEQILLDFNQRSASKIAKANAELEAARENDKENVNEKALAKEQKEAEKREREKERALKRAKRMVKVTSKIEFKPKPFQTTTLGQISLNLDKEHTHLESQEIYDHIRMRNVYPNIKVIQSNLQGVNKFHEYIRDPDLDGDNPDAIRDFRWFMDTIEEPFYLRPKQIITDPEDKSAEFCLKTQKRVQECYIKVYVPAEYLQKTYGIVLDNNCDYENLMKYTAELKRLRVREMTFEQAGKLKFGRYLHNILNGIEQDCPKPKTPTTEMSASSYPSEENVGGINSNDISDTINNDSTISANTTGNASDMVPESATNDSNMSTADMQLTAHDSSIENSNVNSISMDSDTLHEISLNTSDERAAETSLDKSTETTGTIESDQSLNPTDSLLESIQETTIVTESSQIVDEFGSNAPEQTFDVDINDGAMPIEVCLSDDNAKNNTPKPRHSLDDGLGGSVCGSQSDMESLSDMGSFHGFDSLNVPSIVQIQELVPLDTNIFQLPENLLRRRKIFQLTEEYQLAMAARKRKHGLRPDAPVAGKLIKLSSGVVVRMDAESDAEEFLGFDENNDFCMAPALVVTATNKETAATITQRTCSSDSGISPEKPFDDSANTSEHIPNDGDHNMEDCTIISMAEANANSTKIMDESMSVLSAHDSAFTKIATTFESTASETTDCSKNLDASISVLTGHDSGFSELSSTLETNTADITSELNVDVTQGPEQNAAAPEVHICNLSPIPHDLDVDICNEFDTQSHGEYIQQQNKETEALI